MACITNIHSLSRRYYGLYTKYIVAAKSDDFVLAVYFNHQAKITIKSI